MRCVRVAECMLFLLPVPTMSLHPSVSPIMHPISNVLCLLGPLFERNVVPFINSTISEAHNSLLAFALATTRTVCHRSSKTYSLE
uniref:Putative secreted peptide n=1 Tax=Anopheles braziliensis TaxID=58242 RepID=A0A2M3ZMW6_9DIPT